MADKWTIQMRKNGGYVVRDEANETKGSYMNSETAAAHHTFAMQENAKMRRALESCWQLIEKGIEPRVPAIDPAIAQCKELIRPILFPVYERIEITEEKTCRD